MKTYLSFGGGVNSVALYILLKQEDQRFEAVFADHGADWPDTQEYIKWMQANGYPVTVLQARRDGLPLYDYYWQHRMIPTRVNRHCTDHFKIRVLLAYFQNPALELLAFDAGEAHRAEGFPRQNVSFPLIEKGTDRNGCLEIIRRAGWPLPRKSGCFLCPFQRVGQWEELARRYPDLLERAMALEKRSNDKLAEQGRPPMYLADPYPVSVMAAGRFARRLWKKQHQGQLNLWGLATLGECPYCLI